MNNAKKQTKQQNGKDKKIGDIRGTFHVRMGTTKDRNCKDLTEAEEIFQKGGENAQKNATRMVLMTQLTTMVRSLTYIERIAGLCT